MNNPPFNATGENTKANQSKKKEKDLNRVTELAMDTVQDLFKRTPELNSKSRDLSS